MSEPSSSGHLLTDDAFGIALDHTPDDRVVHGSPTTAVRTLGTVGGVEVGVWEMTEGAVHDTEVDEIFVVLTGRGRVDFEDGYSIELTPGVAVRLSGTRTVRLSETRSVRFG